MREIPNRKPEESEDFFDGNAELKKLLGLENKPVPSKGWIKDLKDSSEDDMAELVTGERPSVNGSGSLEVDSLPGSVVADEGATG